MSKERERYPLFIALFIFFLGTSQMYAFGLQWARGFFPFIHEPARVPFSWDMFANRVERCALSWTPAIKVGEHELSSLHEATTSFEWDVTYDHALDYRANGIGLCQLGRRGPTQAHLHCFLPNGSEFYDDIDCK